MPFVWETRHILFAATEMALSIVSVMANGLILLVLVKAHSPMNQRVVNVYIFGLAMADILVSCIVAPTAVTSFLGVPRHLYGCIFINCLALVFTNVSVVVLLVVTFERLLAVVKPIWHKQNVTWNNAVISVLVAYVIGTVLGLVPLMGWHTGDENLENCHFVAVIPLDYYVYVIFFSIHLPCLICMLCVYSRLVCIFREWHQNKQRTTTFTLPQNKSTQSKDSFIRRIAMLAALCITYAVCWLPIDIADMLMFFLSAAPSEKTIMALVLLSHSSSAINPFLYGLFNHSIREGLKKILHLDSGRAPRKFSRFTALGLSIIVANRVFKLTEKESPTQTGTATFKLTEKESPTQTGTTTFKLTEKESPTQTGTTTLSTRAFTAVLTKEENVPDVPEEEKTKSNSVVAIEGSVVDNEVELITSAVHVERSVEKKVIRSISVPVKRNVAENKVIRSKSVHIEGHAENEELKSSPNVHMEGSITWNSTENEYVTRANKQHPTVTLFTALSRPFTKKKLNNLPLKEAESRVDSTDFSESDEINTSKITFKKISSGVDSTLDDVYQQVSAEEDITSHSMTVRIRP